MRHLSSLIAGIVIGVVAWILIGWAQARLGATAVNGISRHDWGAYQLPLLMFAVGGLLIGLVAATRISPIGPFIAGAGYVVLQLAYVSAPHFLDWLPSSFFGQHDIWTRPASSGVAAVLGLVMLVAVLSVRRWQRWPGRPARDRGEVDGADPAGEQFPLAERRSSTVPDTGGRHRDDLGTDGSDTAQLDTAELDRSGESPTYTLPADRPVAGTPTIGHPPSPPRSDPPA